MKFSVIIPVFNEEMYIEKCLESIYSQRYNDYEIIVVDCGSTDKTIELCQKYSIFGIKIIITDTKSVAIQRNIGSKESIGEYLIFLDADTRMFHNYFEITSCYLKKYSQIKY